MDREKALELVEKHVKDKKLFKHLLATEAIMRKLAEHLNENPELWGLTGLLHDIDYEEVEEIKDHGRAAAEIVEKEGFSSEIAEAIRRHNYLVSPPPETPLQIGLVASDAISGLIIAAALMMPDKRLKSVKIKTIKKKFKDKSFARGSNREEIKMIEKVNVPLEEFFGISLRALQGISDQLGL